MAGRARRRSHLARLVSRRTLRAGRAARTGARAALPAGTELRELRPLAPLLPPDSASLLAYARALGIVEGAAPALRRVRRAESARRAPVMSCAAAAPGCGTETFPRLDPAIIVLVTDATGERALLGRQASWPQGRYSTIAGFVEPGESLEDAVVREVDEETGVQVGDVEYVASQPWPFPSSLMLGFRAVARTHDITLRDGELEDARWFTRADIAAGHPGAAAGRRDLGAAHRCAGSARPAGRRAAGSRRCVC